MASGPGTGLRFGAGTAEELRQTILCLLEISRSGRTATMLSVITGRAREEVLDVLRTMSEAGEVALENLPGSVRATITAAGAGSLREEIGHMMVLPRLLVEDAWASEEATDRDGGENG